VHNNAPLVSRQICSLTECKYLLVHVEVNTPLIGLDMSCNVRRDGGGEFGQVSCKQDQAAQIISTVWSNIHCF
jgi:hypothetical protein